MLVDDFGQPVISSNRGGCGRCRPTFPPRILKLPVPVFVHRILVHPRNKDCRPWCANVTPDFPLFSDVILNHDSHDVVLSKADLELRKGPRNLVRSSFSFPSSICSLSQKGGRVYKCPGMRQLDHGEFLQIFLRIILKTIDPNVELGVSHLGGGLYLGIRRPLSP